MDSSEENAQNAQSSNNLVEDSSKQAVNISSDLNQSASSNPQVQGMIRRPTLIKSGAQEPLAQESDLAKASKSQRESLSGSALKNQNSIYSYGQQFNNQQNAMSGIPITSIKIKNEQAINKGSTSMNRDSSVGPSSSNLSKKFQPQSMQRSKSYLKQSQSKQSEKKNQYGDVSNFVLKNNYSTNNPSKRESNEDSDLKVKATNHIYSMSSNYQLTNEIEDPINDSMDISDSAFQTESLFDSNNSKDNVKVCIRVRPLNEREERGAGKGKCVQVENGVVMLDRGLDTKKFTFDLVATPQIDQESIFNQIAKPIADTCLQGYNGTIFAYGQTGAGKTYTIQGPQIEMEGLQDKKVEDSNRNNRGIIQRAYEYIFQNVEAQKKLVEEKADGSELSFLIKCSYLEIYNEQIMDLLEPTSINLHVREDIKKGVYVEGLQEEVVTNLKQMIQLISYGSKNRHVAATNMNRESSRSHSVLTTIIESKSMSCHGVWNMKTSRFHIIDLAGSERSKNTNTVGQQLKEAGMINKSLSALGNVINSLVDLSEGKSRHVPYRDSKLTFILRDSLGGNSKTVIIANISPSQINLGETLSTLEFAKRAKQIKNKPILNEDSSGTILVLKNEIRRLKKDLMEQSKNYTSLLNEKKLQEADNEAKDYICKRCKQRERKTDLVDDEEFQKLMDQSEDEETNPNDDSLLIDDLELIKNGLSPDNQAKSPARTPNRGKSKQLFDMKIQIKKQAERIKQVEQLLGANLENLTSQQNYYEQEIQKHTAQYQELNKAYEQINQQAQRDKMKFKLRDDKIQKLEQDHQLTTDENVRFLQEEIKLLKEQLEQQKNDNTNPKFLKLQAENKQLIDTKNKLQKELDEDAHLDPATLYKQFTDQQGLINRLNEYLQKQASLASYESLHQKYVTLTVANEQLNQSSNEQKDRLEDVQQQYDILLSQNIQAEETNQKLTREYGKAKVELQQLNQQVVGLNQVKARYHQTESSMNDYSQQMLMIDQQIQNISDYTSNNYEESQDQIKFQNELESYIKSLQPDNQKKFKTLNQVRKILIQKLEDCEQQQSKIEQMKNSLDLKEKVIEQKDQIIQQKNDQMWSSKEAMNSVTQENEKEMLQLQAQIQEKIKEKLSSELLLTNMKQQQAEELKEHNLQVAINENLLVQVEEVNKQKNKFWQDLYDKTKENADFENQMKKQEELIKNKVDAVSHLETMIQSKEQNHQEQLVQLQSQLGQQASNFEFKHAQIEQIREKLSIQVKDQLELIEAFKRKNEELEVKMQKENQMFQDQFLKEQNENNENLQRQQREHEELIQAQESDHQNELERQKSEQAEIVLKQTTTREDQLAKQQKSLDEQLQKEKKELQAKMQSKINEINQEMESRLKKQQEDQKLKTNEIQNKMLALQNEMIKENQQKEDEIAGKTLELEKQFQELKIYKSDNQKYREELRQLKEHNKNQESNISYLDISIDQMNQTIHEKAGYISQVEKENKDLLNQKQQLEKAQAQLKEEIKACKQLLQEKQAVTAGQDQEQAETQVLLLEAQDIIDQKVKEAEGLQAKLKEKDGQIGQNHEQIRNLQELLDSQIQDSEAFSQKLTEENDSLKEEINRRLSEIQKLENEKDNLQFKRDEGTKNLEHKIKEYKLQIKNLTESNTKLQNDLNEVNDLQTNLRDQFQKLEDEQSNEEASLQRKIKKLEQENKLLTENAHQGNEAQCEEIEDLKAKNGELVRQASAAQLEINQQVENLKSQKDHIHRMDQASKDKQSNLLREVEDMQEYIDQMQNELTHVNSIANEINSLKNECYKKIEIIKTKFKPVDDENVEDEKARIKECISQVLAEISDISMYQNQSNDTTGMSQQSQISMEVNLLISQIVCEISKLYEKQIVLEKQKASLDFKKFTDKYEKQKNDIKQMQQYHVNKISDMENQNRKIKNELDTQLQNKDQQSGTMKKQTENLSQQMTDLKQQFDEKLRQKQRQVNDLMKEQLQKNNSVQDMNELQRDLQIKLENQIKEKEELMVELERYKIYLPEAEGLLQEVNERHQDALKEIGRIQDQNDKHNKLMQQYEEEILELNKNIKAQKKANQDQKQLYEVRVQSQEQEIEAHQYRYKELEKKTQKDIELQELKFQQVQEQVSILAQSTKQSKKDKDAAMKQMVEMQSQIEIVQENDEQQRQEIQQLKNLNTTREQEMMDIVKTLKQLGEVNKQLENERQRLAAELEMHTDGHRNPQQKIQFHQKIKEENNKLREDNFRLQDDLQKKIEVIQKLQKEHRAQELLESTISPQRQNEQRADNRIKKDYDTLLRHIKSQYQIQNICQHSNIDFEIQGSQSLQKTMDIISLIDDILEQNNEKINQFQQKNIKFSQKITLLEDERDRLLQMVYNNQANNEDNTIQSSNQPPRIQSNMKKSATGQIDPRGQQQPSLNSYRSTSNMSQTQKFSQANLPPRGQAQPAGQNILSSTTSQNELPKATTLNSYRSNNTASKHNQQFNNNIDRARNVSSNQKQQISSITSSGEQMQKRQSSSNYKQTNAAQQQQFSAHQLSQGNPVTLNSYSSIYKQQVNNQQPNRDQRSEMQMHPEKENTGFGSGYEEQMLDQGYANVISTVPGYKNMASKPQKQQQYSRNNQQLQNQPPIAQQQTRSRSKLSAAGQQQQYSSYSSSKMQ